MSENHIFNNNRYLRGLAEKNLPAVKDLERSRIEQGWIWMRKDKIRKLVKPEKIKELEEDGWSRSR